VFAGRIKSGSGLVFSVRELIRTRIAHGSTGVRVFVWGRTRAVGWGGIKSGIELADAEAFRSAVDSVRVAARSYWHRHAAFNAGQLDVGGQ
jgi:hypothetical protein